MADTKEKVEPVGDDAILARAQEIVRERGIGLTSAMIEAEDELRGSAADLPTEFNVTIPVKSRLARWILGTFPAAGGLSTEERLGLWLGRHVLTRERVKDLAAGRETQEIGEGSAVTMRRDEFMRRAGK